jgi:hypothetical protein
MAQIHAVEAWLRSADPAWLNDPVALEARMLADAKAAGIPARAVTDATALMLNGEKIIADAQAGGRPLLPEFREFLDDGAAIGNGTDGTNEQIKTEGNTMSDEKYALQELMRSDFETYMTRKDRFGKTAQDRYLALLEREEARGQLPAPQGKHAPGVLLAEEPVEFKLPAGAVAAPGYRTAMPIAERDAQLRIPQQEK